MRFSITRVHRRLYTVEADDKIVGELSFERGAWGFHYTAIWVNLPRDQEDEFWKLVNDKKSVLGVTEMLRK